MILAIGCDDNLRVVLRSCGELNVKTCSSIDGIHKQTHATASFMRESFLEAREGEAAVEASSSDAGGYPTNASRGSAQYRQSGCLELDTNPPAQSRLCTDAPFQKERT